MVPDQQNDFIAAKNVLCGGSVCEEEKIINMDLKGCLGFSVKLFFTC